MTQLINEAKRFQKLANIKEAEEKQPVDPKVAMDAEKKVFQIVNSDQFNKTMEAAWAKLSDEDRKKLAQSMTSLNEMIGSDFSSFTKLVDKAEEEAGISEADDKAGAQQTFGKILTGIAHLNIAGFFGLPGAALIAATTGLGILPAFAASIAAAGVLWWIGDKLKGKESRLKMGGDEMDESINSVVNEALAKFRKGK